VAAAVPEEVHGKRVALRAAERVLAVGERRIASAEAQGRRSPVHWILIVAADSGVAGDIHAIGKVWPKAHRLAAEPVLGYGGKLIRHPGSPLKAGVDTKTPRLIDKTEEIRIVATRTLQIEIHREGILSIDGRVQATLHIVLMGDANGWSLIVVTGNCLEAGNRKQFEQGPGLRRDPFLWDAIVREG
jgi:hypothetical protein